MENRVLLAIEFVKDIMSQHYPMVVSNYARRFKLPTKIDFDPQTVPPMDSSTLNYFRPQSNLPQVDTLSATTQDDPSLEFLKD